MRNKLGAGNLAGLVAITGLLLLPSCTAQPGDASAQVPGVQNGEIHGDTTIILRRVFEGSGLDFYSSEPSPDGRYLTEIDWDTGDLAVIDLLAGEQRRITDKGGWTTSSDYAETGVFSPDGGRIAYAWFNCAEHPCVYEIRVSDADGSDMRTLYSPEADPGRTRPYETFYPMLHGWVGDQILTMVYLGAASDPRAELGLFSATDGSFRSLVEFGQDVAGRVLEDGQMALSPSGRFAAYGIRSVTGADEDIVIVSTSDGHETGRITGPATDRVFGFSPGGAGLLFGSNRELTEGIWNQPLRDGRPDGAPVLLRSDLWRTIPIGVSRDARRATIRRDHAVAHLVAGRPTPGLFPA